MALAGERALESRAVTSVPTIEQVYDFLILARAKPLEGFSPNESELGTRPHVAVVSVPCAIQLFFAWRFKLVVASGLAIWA